MVCGVPPCDVFVPGPVHPGGTPGWASAGLVVTIDAAAITAGATVLRRYACSLAFRGITSPPYAPRRPRDVGAKLDANRAYFFAQYDAYR